MAILNNPMGALAAVNAQTQQAVAAHPFTLRPQQRSESSDGGPNNPVVEKAAGVGSHGFYTCCGLCEDIADHANRAQTAYDMAYSAYSRGEVSDFLQYGHAAVAEYESLKDAVASFELSCGEYDSATCKRDHCPVLRS